MLDGTAADELSREDINRLLENIDQLSDDEVVEIEKLVEELEKREHVQRCRDNLIEFCKHMQQDYKVGAHHRRLASLLEDIERREKDRICVSVPPRHGKSQLTSIYYTAWYLGRNPGHKVMLVSHTTDLAVDFGRKVRNLIADAAYQEIFPETQLSKDSKSAGRWNTTEGGEFYATGVGAALAGRGAHLLVVDDPHSEQDVLAGNFTVFEKAYDWFAFGARTRLMPGGAVAVVHTRWHQDDMIGRLIRDMTNNEAADQYEIFEFPAILEKESKDLLTGEITIKEKALWPEFFDLDALKRTKASMPVYQWNSQFQQKPTAEEASIVKREWWRLWQKDDPPGCEYIIMTLDAAAEAHNRADFTALTTWGVFYNEEESAHNIILLNAIKQRLEFPELKELALQEYQDWDPDVFIVEKKSSGTPLYQELRRMGIPVGEYTPVRGTQNNPNTKMARLNSVADIVRSGLVWAPDRRWADDLIEEVAGFPFMRHDDQCFVADTLISMADGGTKRIADVRVGDLVRTPAGPKPVIEAGFTGVREVYELQVGGASLVGTGNHPIATTKGWKPLDTITVGDTIKMESAIWRAPCLGPLNPIQLWSQLSSTVENLTVTLNRPMHRFANTFGAGAAGESAFIEPFGSSITGLYPRGGTSTTKMETSTTTILRTLSVCPPTNTQPSTPKSEASTQAVPSSSNTWRGYGQKPPNGTAPRKVKNGTLRLPQSISTSEARRGKPTKNVESARRPTLSRATARSVVRSFYRRLAVLSSAAMRAHVGAPPARKGSAPVYNLSVADAKCFYANGVLSHNCDATIMALMRFRQGGFLRLPTDEYEDELPYRQKVEYY